MVERKGYTRNDIYNADETSINWKVLLRKSFVSFRESSAPRYKVSKVRITVMICANTIGDHALPLLVIGKAIKPRCLKNINRLLMTYKAQKKLEINNKIDVKNWLENDANDLRFEILNDGEIVESVKESELFAQIENEYEDAENYTGRTPGEIFTVLEAIM
ncbi:tigger transposable element-derived protein 2-like [Melanaphis sacchari]|uniref:tigger transposable element-derived protein 2-like n=1 Tax=Melanaphis sacchari TaxID=742174 RepID=UPI000DC15222|nr:tigger transposable element-derived protein 2-like [Melanaphis sacchari]